MTWLRGWRPLLRLAWRDAFRAKGRSTLVLVMIALPVLGVVAAAVVLATSDVSGAEAIDRRLGAADAKVMFQPGQTDVVQDVDPDRGAYNSRTKGTTLGDASDVVAAWGDDVRTLEWRTSSLRVETPKGITYAEGNVLDIDDPLAAGIWRVESGRAAAAPGEVVLNTYLSTRTGAGVGESVTLADGTTYDVVGVGENTSYRDTPLLVGVDPAIAAGSDNPGRTLLVDAGGPVTWDDVRTMNALGGVVVSRAVLLDPPPASEIPEEVRGYSGGTDDAFVAVVVLIIVMALIEVVLLAGPAFAVGARRQSRDLALMAATGGTPTQARRVILASGLVLGSLGALLGVVLGLVIAVAVLPLVQRFSGSWLGPFDIPVPYVAGIAVFGLASALLAAVVPAWIASRQDVVAVLAGRRADRPAGLRSPILGLALVGAGAAGSAFGALQGGGGELLIAASAIPAVLGMILLVPLVLVGLGRLSGKLPLVLRYAVRDAARHRTRTVPAVAAVAATVAGVVALGVANASDAEQSRATYQPTLSMGDAALIVWDEGPDVWAKLRPIIDRELPGTTVEDVYGVQESTSDGGFQSTRVRLDGEDLMLDGWQSGLGSSVLVGDRLPDGLPQVTDEQRAAATQALGAGGVVVFANAGTTGEQAAFAIKQYGPQGGRGTLIGKGSFPAYVAEVPPGQYAPAQAVLSTSAADELGLDAGQVGIAVTGGVTGDQEKDVQEAVSAVSDNASFYVERGFQNDDEVLILLLVLGVLGGVLMLGGTLTATFLALSDARPDLATLAAVGASPRSRRGVAASYAVVVGLVGALLGAAVGFIPGIAVTYPLTGEQWMQTVDPNAPSHYLAIPWLLIGSLVVVLPLLTALVVGLTARSRLPLVSRLA